MWYSQLGAIGVLFSLTWFPWRVTMSDFIWYRSSCGYNTNVEVEPKSEYCSIFNFIFVYAGFNFAVFNSKPSDLFVYQFPNKSYILFDVVWLMLHSCPMKGSVVPRQQLLEGRMLWERFDLVSVVEYKYRYTNLDWNFWSVCIIALANFHSHNIVEAKSYFY